MTDQKDAVPTITYDHRDDESRLDPWPRWKHMREDEPIFYSDTYEGFYVLSRYQDVAESARDTDAFSSELDGTTIPKFPTPKLPPIHSDPPGQRQWREIINPHFSPAKVEEYEPWIRELVTEQIDPLLASNGFDVAGDIGLPITRAVILKIMGIPDAPAELNQWSDDMTFGVGEVAQLGAQNLMGYLMGQIAQRRQAPDDGLISAMFQQRLEMDDRLLDDEDILKMLVLLMGAALETTNSAICAMVHHLLEHPEAAARMRAEPGIWRKAMDEFVRWASPASALARTTRYDTEVSGCPIPAGSKVMLLYGSGNHDEQEFPNAEEVVLDRSPNRHLGFGMGPHRCLGSHLAKSQMTIVLERLLPALDQWSVEDPSKIEWVASVTRGMKSLPLVRK